MKNIHKADPIISQLITAEQNRLEQELNLIASENYTSPAVLQATGSVLTNKYAEGYPGQRYYAGCQVIDQVENIAIERAKKLFNAEHANVQPHAGSQANMAVYFALLQPGDTILGMSLAEGGHLTHGHKVNFSGQFYKSVQYKVNPQTEQLDYDEIEQLALEHKPKLIICGASAYSRIIDFERLSIIAKKVNAYLHADIAHIAGLIAANLHPNPFPHADVVTTTTHKTLRGPRGGMILCKKELAQKIDKAIMPGTQGGPFMHIIAAKAVAFAQASTPEFVNYQKQVIKNAQAMAKQLTEFGMRIVSGGTDNHLFIVDVRSKNINGLQAEQALQKIGITISRSCIPFDPEKPWITSGIRIGTPAVTTRGMKELEMADIAHYINQALTHHENEDKLAQIKERVTTLCNTYPIYRQTNMVNDTVCEQLNA
ncbi:MAG: serine hydroxymethyltransferase [Candidatus Dependentiae bacterium]